MRATSTGQLPEGMRTSFLPGIQDIAYGLTDISHRQVAHTLRQRHTWKQHLPDTLTRAWNEERGDQNRCQKIMHQSKIHSLKHPAERWSSRNFLDNPHRLTTPPSPLPPTPHTQGKGEVSLQRGEVRTLPKVRPTYNIFGQKETRCGGIIYAIPSHSKNQHHKNH